MTNFTPLSGALGGLLIGLSVTMMMLFLGRITGISGIFGGLLLPKEGDTSWRALFISGLVVGGVLLSFSYPKAMSPSLQPSMVLLVLSGILVGFGTRMGSGCTSGHGICGIARFSIRSLVATLSFLGTGMLTVYIMKHAIS